MSERRRLDEFTQPLPGRWTGTANRPAGGELQRPGPFHVIDGLLPAVLLDGLKGRVSRSSSRGQTEAETDEPRDHPPTNGSTH